jgi:hypothetical protein
MKTKLLSLVASVAIGGLASIGTANADTYATYNVYGSFADAENNYIGGYTVSPGPIPLGGTLYIDVTAGSVISANLTIPGYAAFSAPAFAPLNNIASQFTLPNITGELYQLNLSSLPGDSGDTGYVVFIVPYEFSNPLIGNPSILIDQGEFFEPFGTSDHTYIPYGLTGYIQATPIPATWTMLIAGFVGLGFFACRGQKKHAALAA